MDGDINILCRLGEDSLCEFKSMHIPGASVTAPDARDVADEMAAAANAAGATFLFGVNDRTRKIEGIPERKLDIAETWIRNICNDSVKPALAATIRKVMVKGRAGKERCIIRVDVPKSLFVHESPHGYFYRIGSSKRKMPPEVLARLFQQRSQTRLVCFDEQVVPKADVGELIPELYSRFRTGLSSPDDGEFLRKLHFVAPDADGVMRPTVAGVLFATEHPQTHLPSAFVQAVCYRGKERNADDQLDARDITGPLDVQIDEACRFVARNMRVAAIKNPARIDIPQYAMNAVFEAIVNAVAHRDYSIAESKIRLHMFSDRLEIFSPGGLPNSLTIEEIGERQFSRNELICTCLSRCALKSQFAEVSRMRIMDKRGEGVPVIMAASGKLSGERPSYRLLGDSELLLTIYSTPIDNRKRLRSLVAAHENAKKNTKTAHVEMQPTKTRTNTHGTINETIKAEDETIKHASETINETIKEGCETIKLANETINEAIKPAGETIKAGGETIKDGRETIKPANETINEIINAFPGISLLGLVAKSGRSRSTISRVLAILRRQGVVEYRGSKKTGGYYLVRYQPGRR